LGKRRRKGLVCGHTLLVVTLGAKVCEKVVVVAVVVVSTTFTGTVVAVLVVVGAREEMDDLVQGNVDLLS
jgi:hypothetical protein